MHSQMHRHFFWDSESLEFSSPEGAKVRLLYIYSRWIDKYLKDQAIEGCREQLRSGVGASIDHALLY